MHKRIDQAANNKGLMMNEILNKAIEHFGASNQLTVATEELCELAKELCKAKRKIDAGETIQNRTQIIEEFSDVLIVLEQVRIIFDIKEKEIKDSTKSKLGRLKKLVND